MSYAEQLDLIDYLAHDAAEPLADAEAGPCVRHGHSPPSIFPIPLRPRMSAHRLLVCLVALGWSARELARRTGRHRTTVARWRRGTSPVDADVAAWLETLVALHQAHPAPRTRRSRVTAQAWRGGLGSHWIT